MKKHNQPTSHLSIMLPLFSRTRKTQCESEIVQSNEFNDDWCIPSDHELFGKPLVKVNGTETVTETEAEAVTEAVVETVVETECSSINYIESTETDITDDIEIKSTVTETETHVTEIDSHELLEPVQSCHELTETIVEVTSSSFQSMNQNESIVNVDSCDIMFPDADADDIDVFSIMNNETSIIEQEVDQIEENENVLNQDDGTGTSSVLIEIVLKRLEELERKYEELNSKVTNME